MPEEIETAAGTMLIVAGLIEMVRTAGTEHGNELYDAFDEIWDVLGSHPDITADERANLAFEAAEMVGCPIKLEGRLLAN